MKNPATTRPREIELDDYRWLVSSAAESWLSSLPNAPRPSAADAAALRRELSSARTHLVLEQIELRRRAIAKFTAAERMFFTGRALEQATDEVTASYKALRFDGIPNAMDLCTGIGGDMLALAQRCPTVGVDRDETMAVLAEANAQAILTAAIADVSLLTRDVGEVDVRQCAAWHIDPDRRPHGRRTTRVELHEPNLDTTERLLARNENAGIKLAPAAELPEAWQRTCELEWISRQGECRQLVAWFGNLTIQSGQRRATMLGANPTPLRTLLGVPLSDEPEATHCVQRFVYEPDPALLAAGLAPNLAAEHDLARIATGIAYWTADRPVTDAALACFEVEETLPLDVKRLRAWLHERNVGRLEIKKRGVELSPERLRQDLRLRGNESKTLIVTRVAGKVAVIVARRIIADG